MDRSVVVSKNLASVGYDAVNGALEIEFRNGCVYEYFRVPTDVFAALISATSKGEYFTSPIKDIYRYQRVL